MTKPETAPHGDAEMVRALAAHGKLVDEINAGLHSPDGNVSKDATDREYAFEDLICSRPAQTFEGVAVKLRLAAFHIKQEEKDQTEDRCALSALEDIERLVGGVQDGDMKNSHKDAALLALEAEIVKEYANIAAVAKTITDPADETVNQMTDQLGILETRFGEMPVNTLEGVAAKLRQMRFYVEDERLSEFPLTVPLVKTTLETVERLIGKAS